MKQLYIIILILSAITSNAQIINFPDPFLKANLLSLGNIDQNGDSEIDIAEAIAVDSLSLNYSGISNLSGLENFSNLVYFYLRHTSVNDLTPLEGMLGLEVVNCQDNELIDLTPIMSLHLKKLDFKANNITSFDITPLAGTLEELICDANPISSLNLNNGNNALKRISISHTQISQFSYSGTTLQYFGALGYNLTEVNLAGHIGSIEISTPATSLDLSGVTWGSLTVNGSNLNYLNVKNGVTTPFTLTYVHAPNLQHLCINDNTNWQSWSINPMVVANTYCSFSPGGTLYTLQGENRVDESNDGCDESDDLFSSSLKYQITNGSATGMLISNFSGVYSWPVSAGTHTLTPLLENPEYFTVTPSPVTITFPDQPSPFSQDFCIVPAGSFVDTEIIIIPVGPARPGFDADYDIIFKNKGTTVASGSVLFNFDDDILDFISASQMPALINGNDLTWQFTDLLPFETRVISLTMNVNSPMETPPVNISDILLFNAMVNGLEEDLTPFNNLAHLEQEVVGAFDPNDITCLEGDSVAPEVAGQYVHYVIRFENTGNYPATNVVVKDMINLSKFDINTLVTLNSSHDFVSRITGNKVEFIFENIMLPFDDAMNDGYIVFKIKIKPSLVIGDTFTQQADIYFDFNHPIVTNTATTTISALATADFSNQKFAIYPNPAYNQINITSNKAFEIQSVTIYNLLGQIVLSIPDAQPGVIDVSMLKSGHYLIKLQSASGTATQKFIKL